MDCVLNTKNQKIKLPAIKIIKNVFIQNCEPFLKELQAIKSVIEDIEFIQKLVAAFGQDKLIFSGFQISKTNLNDSKLSIIKEESLQLQETKTSQKQEEKPHAPSLTTILQKFQKSLPTLTRSMTSFKLDEQMTEELDNFIVNEEISLPHFLKILKLFVHCDIDKHMEQIISCLMIFNDLAVSKNQFHWMLLEQNANQVVLSLIALLAKSLDNQKKLQEQFLDYFLSMFIKVITLKPLLTACSMEILASLLEYLLNLLIWETEQLKTISETQTEEKFIIESVLKWAHKILVRVLEVSNPKLLLSGLLSLFISQNKEENSEKNVQSIKLINGFLIKFGKLIPTYAQANRQLDIPAFIDYVLEYIEIISKTIKTQNLKIIEKDARIQTIKYLFYQIYFSYSDENKLEFEKFCEGKKEKNSLLFQWMELCFNQHKIESHIKSLMQTQNQQQQINTETEKQLKALLTCLYNNNNFNSNLEILFNLLFTHQNIVLDNYLNTYPPLFQELVKSALEAFLKIQIKHSQDSKIQQYLKKILPEKQESCIIAQTNQQNYYLVKNRYNKGQTFQEMPNNSSCQVQQLQTNTEQETKIEINNLKDKNEKIAQANKIIQNSNESGNNEQKDANYQKDSQNNNQLQNAQKIDLQQNNEKQNNEINSSSKNQNDEQKENQQINNEIGQENQFKIKSATEEQAQEKITINQDNNIHENQKDSLQIPEVQQSPLNENEHSANLISSNDLISSPSKVIKRQQLAKHKVNLKKSFNQQHKRKKFKFHPIYQRLHGIRKWILFQKYKKTKIQQCTVQKYTEEHFLEEYLEDVSNFSSDKEAKIEIADKNQVKQDNEIIIQTGEESIAVDSEQEINQITNQQIFQEKKNEENEEEDEFL